MALDFDYEKGTQALNYYASSEGGNINKMKVLKLIYFADRYHLRKYGRLITNDTYLAMKHGPVPSAIKDIAESNDYLDEDYKDYSSKFIEPIDNLTLRSIEEVDDDVFSESDLEALKFAWEKFGSKNQFELRDLTHKYPEWRRHETRVESGSCLPMQLVDFLKDPTDDVDKCFELSETDKAIREEYLTEMAQIKALWS